MNIKKILLVLSLSLSLISCSSVNLPSVNLSAIELSAISPSDVQTEKILALGLSHDQNLVEARKIADPNIASAVIKELNNRILEDENNRIELENVVKYAEMVKASDNNLKFVGTQISEKKSRNIVGKDENQNYFLIGLKDKNNSSIHHKINFSITYNLDAMRSYSSASFCDKWQGCENEDLINISLISSKASGCNASTCNYTEVMELDLSDDFLRSNMEEGFSISFNSKKYSNKVIIPSSYIKGYLMVAN